jgi:hypothetical protein
MRKGLRIAKEAIDNTGTGERILYLVLVAFGVVLIVLGWRLDAHGWATAHPYATGLLDGATGFCFGIPVAGVLIREINRRTRRRLAVDTFITQLDYLGRLVKDLSQGPMQELSGRLRVLAKTANMAASDASANAVARAVSIKIISIGVILVKPELPKNSAASLRATVEARRVWASLSFACGRLISDATQLIPLLYPPVQQPDPWLDRLVSTLETMRAYQSAVSWRWLPAAVNPQGFVTASAWNLGLLPVSEAPEDSEPTSDMVKKQQLAEAIEKRAAKELEDEARDLSNRLDALADLVDAAATCRDRLTTPAAIQDRLEMRITNQPQWQSFDDLAYLVTFQAEITNTTGRPVDVRQIWLYAGPDHEAALSQDALAALDHEYGAKLAGGAPPQLRPGTIRANGSATGLSVYRVLRSAVDGRPPQCFFVVIDAEGTTYTAPVPLS